MTDANPPASAETSELRGRVIAALREVYDPELPVNLYDLGLIYELDVDDAGAVAIRMTLTTPNCPVADMMPQQVHDAARAVDGVAAVDVSLVWEPKWTGEMMSEDAKLLLEMQGIEWTDPHKGLSNRPTPLTFGRTSRPRE
jgi:FeS assembly SUF system protein